MLILRYNEYQLKITQPLLIHHSLLAFSSSYSYVKWTTNRLLFGFVKATFLLVDKKENKK